MNRRTAPSGPRATSRPEWPARLAPAILALATFLAVGCAPEPEPAVFPAEAWERWSVSEEGGLSSEGLARVEERLGEMSTSAMMVVTGGRVAFEYGDVAEVSYLASVRKSILVILYGIHRDRGSVDLDLTLEELGIDDHRGLTPRERQATNRHLILARSGVYHPASNSGDNLSSAPEPGSQEPGSYYLYSNWDFNAAGTAFEIQTGTDLFDSLEQELAIPLGFRDFDRERHQKGGNLEQSVHPSYHMHLSTRDMARIGYLALREGEWDGRQIVSSGWIREMTTAHTPVHEMNPEGRRDGPHGYGYMWWIWDGEHASGPYEGAYTGVGAVGQYITVLPALDMVVAHKTVPGQGRSVRHPDFWELLDLVVEAHCGDACP